MFQKKNVSVSFYVNINCENNDKSTGSFKI